VQEESNGFWGKVAQVGIIALMGWALLTAHSSSKQSATNGARIAAWHTQLGAEPSGAAPAHAMVTAVGRYQGVSMGPVEGLEFAQRSMVKAHREIRERNYAGALGTLRLALEDTGLRCREVHGRLECN
jgi:hypothetical protein